jgi:ABC-type Na+ efflux pump permease subunit
VRVRASLLAILYLGAGLVVAGIRDYFEDIDRARDVISAALAVLLWPLVLLGVDLRLRGSIL